ncbi:hypothetical protein KJ632_04300 [Patescibacteria group bacterium]|nr:hypothetical protein [Patescibacteria group bacterium]
MNPLKLLHPDYLFNPYPGSTFLYFWPLVIFFVLLFASSWYASALISQHRHAKVAKEFLGGIPMRIREFAIIGLLFTFFRWQNVPWLGMRVWIIIIFILAAAYGIWVWQRYKKGFRKALRANKSKEVEDMYRPKPKKKRR